MATARRRVDVKEGRAALDAWLEAARSPSDAPLPRNVLATAVRYTLEEVTARAPGNSVEVRVPPYSAIQVIPGVRHKRGTPPAVIETDAETWIALATGDLSWVDAEASGKVTASGERADLTPYLPLT